MTDRQPVLNQLNLVVSDMDATVAFYRRLGVIIEAKPGAQHVAAHLPGGLLIEWDTPKVVTSWDSGWKGAVGGSTVLGFSVPSRETVDVLYADLVAAGHQGHQPPYDAFWGARYAIVEDPDGNCVGLMGPEDDQRRFWPPSVPPSAS